MKVDTILIICNGEKPANILLRRLIHSCDFIICADGGANHAASFRITPDLIIGDMDSISEKTEKKFNKIKSIKISDQESTDLEKALNYSRTIKPKNVKIISAFGDRIDHSLCNLSILKKYQKYFDIEIYSNKNILRLLSKPFQFIGKIGKSVSLIPIGKVKKVKIEGLKYPLNEEDLEFGVREGQSNIITCNPVKIQFQRGELFLITEL